MGPRLHVWKCVCVGGGTSAGAGQCVRNRGDCARGCGPPAGAPRLTGRGCACGGEGGDKCGRGGGDKYLGGGAVCEGT
jgi:hypothetical protein